MGWRRASGFYGWTLEGEVVTALKVSSREGTMAVQGIEVDCLSFVAAAAAAAGGGAVVVWW